MYRYQLHGLDVLSEFPFADTFPAKSSDSKSLADVVIKRGVVGPARKAPATAGDYKISGTQVFLDIPQVARYKIENGATITVEFAAGASLIDVCAFLLGSALGALLHQRGLFPIHASGVQLGSSVAAFLGPSGAGKSTTAALFAAQGCPLVSDDVLVARQDGDRFLAECSLPVVKLLPDSLCILRSRTIAEAGRIEVPKRRITDPSLFAVRSLPLDRLFFLSEPSATASIKALSQFEILERLRQNIYRPELIAALGHERAFFAFAVELVRSIAGFEVSRGPDKNDFIATLASVF